MPHKKVSPKKDSLSCSNSAKFYSAGPVLIVFASAYAPV